MRDFWYEDLQLSLDDLDTSTLHSTFAELSLPDSPSLPSSPNLSFRSPGIPDYSSPNLSFRSSTGIPDRSPGIPDSPPHDFLDLPSACISPELATLDEDFCKQLENVLRNSPSPSTYAAGGNTKRYYQPPWSQLFVMQVLGEKPHEH